MESQVTKTILLGTAGIIAYNLFVKGKALGTIDFEPGEVHSLQFVGFNPVLTVGIIAINSSSQKFVIRSIAGRVTSNGYYIGYISFSGYQEINPTSSTQILVPIVFSSIGLVQDIINAFNTGSTTQNIEFAGYANVDNFQVPINNKWKIGV